MTLRRISSLAAVTLSVTLAAACAKGTGNAAEPQSSFNPSATLSGSLQVMGFGGDDEIGQVRLAEAKKALGSGVKVSQVKGDLDIQQFLSAVASGQPPEIVYANRDQIGTFASRGARTSTARAGTPIVPLTSCIEGEGIDTSAFRKPAPLRRPTRSWPRRAAASSPSSATTASCRSSCRCASRPTASTRCPPTARRPS